MRVVDQVFHVAPDEIAQRCPVWIGRGGPGIYDKIPIQISCVNERVSSQDLFVYSVLF
jgi:hypothetical protein